MANLFVCSTAYQLLNAILITTNENKIADIILTKKSMESICNIDILSKTKIFRDIYFWYELSKHSALTDAKTEREYLAKSINKLYLYARKNRIYKTIPNKDKSYCNIYLGYADFPNQYIYYFFKKKGAYLYLYEDGTYTYECLSIKPHIIRKGIAYFLFHSWIMDEVKGVYVRRIKEVNLGTYENKIIVKRINDRSDLNDLLLRIFNNNREEGYLFNKNVIFFDQNIEYKSIRDGQTELAEKIAQSIGNDNLLIKLHPGSESNNYSFQLIKYKGRVPFEILLSIYSMTEKILISVFSTACFSPKYMLNQEPYIIFTYRALGLEKVAGFNKNYLKEINNLKALYSDPSRIIIPNSIEEAVRIVIKINELR